MRMIDRFRNQPRGVYLLFATEFWERFSYYGFIGMFVLFAVAPRVSGGLGMESAQALLLFGVVTSLVWVAPIAGGWFADRIIGARRAVGLGCVGLVMANLALAGSSLAASHGDMGLAHAGLAVGVLAMITGAGLFKSNASSLLGQLFAPGDGRRENGFILFYMGINLGALVAPFGAGTLGEKVGWAWGFLAAAAGMVVGLLLFLWKAPRLFPESAHQRAAMHSTVSGEPLLRNPQVQFILLMAMFAIIYMTGQMTYGGVMNLYTDRNVDRLVGEFVVPTTWFMSLNPLLVILLGPFVADLWARRDGSTSRILFVEKIVYGLALMSLSFLFLVLVEARVEGLRPAWAVVVFYILITAAELCVLPAGLAEISRRAPASAMGLMMGCWIFTMGAGSLLAGWLASSVADRPTSIVFLVLAVAGAGGAILLFGIEPVLRRRMSAQGIER
jgi:POT family proton-dependent oligopeptide transporter